jgi:HPt (histidine-containing phosphotransfer) domain-containing protein
MKQMEPRISAALDDFADKNAAPALDPFVIDELRKVGGNHAFFQRILNLSSSHLSRAVERVENMRHSTDLAAIADAVHALKSICSNIGARRATAACHALEHAARTGRCFDTGERIGLIAAEMLDVMTEIERLRAAA